MTIVGRITKDAVINSLKDERTVINFTIAINDYYKSKNKHERVQLTTYINCAYWRSSNVADHLQKGVLVELEGRLYTEAFISKEGEAKASLKCHVNGLKIHGGSKKNTTPPALDSEDAVVTSDVEFIDEATPF